MPTPLNFQSDPYVDTLIFCGQPINIEKYAELKNPGIKQLTEQAKARALMDLNTSFENHKAHLHFNLGSLAERVKHYKENIQIDHAEGPVIHKMEEMIAAREQEERGFGTVHRFFHKVSQWLSGHGFRTEAQWAKSIVEEVRNEPNVDEITRYFKNYSSFNPLDSRILNAVKHLDSATIEQLAKEDAFNVKELLFSPFGNLNSNFLTHLDEEQKKAFFMGISQHEDFFPVLQKILIKEDFFSDETPDQADLIRSFHPFLPHQQIVQRLVLAARREKNLNLQQPLHPQFEQYLAELAIKRGVERDNYVTLAHLLNILNLELNLNKVRKQIQRGEIQPLVLSENELSQLNANLKID
ncbi:hypothetical protein [Candidatus Protochlamydia phocaeensis]|uniref:hypothetical protein n=1 Tax=Candidatus Protochlamydia phocaeensis TaxID=1414722 RepID=UPI0008381165|nr:hypothetical protein [Candidatus Protochlamydia phocaeensis]